MRTSTSVIIAGLAILAAAAGVFVALQVDIGTPGMEGGGTDTSQRRSESRISEIKLGALADEMKANEPNPPIDQKRTGYSANERLVLRVTVEGNQSASLRARYLDEGGNIHQLSPPNLTFQPGTSGFCCWTFDKSGEYTIQLFKPDGTITSIPVHIR